ncbi:Gfo/Idh/MocA family protein [Mangrovibacterium marinum]|uniref:Putative dehydrogenase n=1 Tax=Mangrovibacterium marinum TaxID=1639118 RepID=A0A2T5BUF7_9BACT|nr:Gfo/Idh/MocA family oxidoreductase [Mangrovibacterium marinum]PTN03146.1 putative dehydrogenase [Mangrovibacterium marinum]
MIRWGILSTAKIGLTKVIPALQNSRLGEVTAISSRVGEQAEKAARQLGIAKAYSSYEELLSDPDIDAIYNPLPNHLHVEWTLKALRAGKHVLCEKPIGMNRSEAIRLEAESRKFPTLKVMEAFMYRFHPQWVKAKQLIDAGTIGQVKTVQSFFSYFNADPNNIRNKPEVGGGALMDIGCYCISFPRFLFAEEPSAVMGFMDVDPQMRTDRLTSGILKFAAGKSSSFTCSTQLCPFQQVHILGDQGRITVEIPVNAPPTQKCKIILMVANGRKEIEFDAVDQYSLQADAFAEAILNNTPAPTPLTDAIANMAVIDAIRASAEQNTWINIE